MLQKLAVATVAIAVTLAAVSGLSRLFGTADERPAVASGTTTAEALQPVNGLRPLPEIIDLWRDRAEAQPLDYLSRTQLGLALSTEARERADLDGHAEAETALREALALNPQHQAARLGLAQALIAQHDFAAADTEVGLVLEARPDSLPALALAGDVALELGRYEEAAAFYDRLLAAERSAPTVSRLARLRWFQGRPDEAVTLAGEALELSGDLALRPSAQSFYWFQVGHYRFENGDIDGALAAHDEALTLDPGNPAAAETRAFVLASAGRRSEAIVAYQELVEGGAAADVHGLYADVLRLDGDEAEAASQEQLAVELALDPEAQHEAERRHLVGYWITRDPAQAVRLAQADLATRADVGAHDALAWALHHDGRHDEATEAIAAALAVGTRDAELLYHAGAIAAANGDEDAAREHLSAALALNPRFHPTDAAAAHALLAELS